MEVLQLEVIGAGNGFCIAAYDEIRHCFCRLSKESYQRFETARDALYTGAWTLV